MNYPCIIGDRFSTINGQKPSKNYVGVRNENEPVIGANHAPQRDLGTN